MVSVIAGRDRTEAPVFRTRFDTYEYWVSRSAGYVVLVATCVGTILWLL